MRRAIAAAGKDRLMGGAGNDLLFGGYGTDTIDGGGIDMLSGSVGAGIGEISSIGSSINDGTAFVL